MDRRVVILVILLSITLVLPLVLTALGVRTPLEVLELGKYYIRETIEDTASPEAVAAVVWDYRGLDTIYETAVLYLAIVGGLAIFRAFEASFLSRTVGLTTIARTSTRILGVLIAVISMCIALHGHLTPGGGFPGGSALAVATMLLIPVYSVQALLARGVTSTRLVAIRGLALTAIGLVALLPVVKGLEIVTNQRFYPAEIFGFTISGSISLYNIFEFLAVASGFTALALYLSIPEEYARLGEAHD